VLLLQRHLLLVGLQQVRMLPLSAVLYRARGGAEGRLELSSLLLHAARVVVAGGRLGLLRVVDGRAAGALNVVGGGPLRLLRV
jgi:hypothetical protein